MSLDSFLDSFLETAWNDHGGHPREVADRLVASTGLVTAPGQVAPFARLVTHVFGEHLGEWSRGIELLESLRPRSDVDGGAAADAALNLSIATLRYASGDGAALTPLSAPDRVCVLATAASAFAGRNAHRIGVAAYTEALALAQAGLPAGSPAVRALAVGGNNLAAALEEKKDRDAFETDGMVAAAQGGLTYWKLAGTWLQEERAENRLTRSLLRAGQPMAAMESARRCIAVCKRHDAPAFEQFFAFAGLALAHRDAGDAKGFAESRTLALALFAQLPPDEKPVCATDITELG